mmetsp:Transcript_6372/g.9891  ORF Transcript_6372/g.9891 Transcript_6372/m.9891 type:complete len:85 (+) Transcript_6372:16-270(+)
MHQIRAHMAHEGHPLVGDALYGAGKVPWCSRMFLHAWNLMLDLGDGPLNVEMPPASDLRLAMAAMEPVCTRDRASMDRWLQHGP